MQTPLMMCGISLMVALLGCGPTAQPENLEETMQVLSAPGEFPSMNELTAPQGAALRAVNVVVDVGDEYTTHRGLEKSAAGGRPWSSLTYYAGGVVAHSETDGVLARLVAGVWEEYSGTFNAPPGEVMAFQETSGALFLTTSNGLYRLDGLTAEPVLSGLSQGLPGTGAITASPGFLTEGFTVAYRHSWAQNLDANGNIRLMESAPSPRLLVNNPTATAASRDVAVSWPIPEDLPASAYNRTFRSDATVETVSPTDEVRQVYERAPTDAERTAGYFTFTDNAPDTVKGPGAYFSANTGEGIAQSNYKSMLAHGITSFNDSLFAVSVDGVQRLTLNILGTGPGGLQAAQIIEINAIDNSWGENYFGDPGGEIFPSQFQLFTGPTPALAIAATVASLCRAINSRMGGHLFAFALDTDGTNPGGLVLQTRTVSDVAFNLFTDGNGQAFAPALKEQRTDIIAISRTAGVVTVEFFGAHSFAVDDQVVLSYEGSPDPDFPVGTKTVTSTPMPTQITYAEAGPDVVSALLFPYVFESSGDPPESSSGTASNAYAWAKQGEPDHWPLANLAVVGGATDTLWWGAPLDRFLFLGSTAGLWRLQGNSRDGFSFMDNGVWDSTVSFLGRRNVAVIDGQAFAVAREGLVSWSEGSKPDAVDIPIQDEIRAIVAAIPELVASIGFMVADQSNHRLYVCLPQVAEDTAATRCHVLSTRTRAWTRLDNTFPGFEDGFLAGFSPQAGTGVASFVTPAGGALEGRVLSTRATYTDVDYQGPNGEAVPAEVTYLPLVAGEPARLKQWTWTRVFTKDPNANASTTKLEVCFATEQRPAAVCQLLPDVDPIYTGWEPVQDPVRGIAWKTIVDKFGQRGKALTVSVGRAVVQQPLHLMGIEVKHRPYGGGQ